MKLLKISPVTDHSEQATAYVAACDNNNLVEIFLNQKMK